MKSLAVRRPSNVPSNTVSNFPTINTKSSERGVIKRGVRNAQIFLRFSFSFRREENGFKLGNFPIFFFSEPIFTSII